MARCWTFRDFVTPGGENVIHAWLHAQKPKARARINTVIAHLEASPRTEWGDYIKGLSEGECAGLLEIRVTFNNIQYRPLACYGPGRQEVTILLGAIERGDRFEPRSACRTAQANRRLITEKGRTVEHDVS